MTTRLSDLKPSPQDPVPAAVLRGLPLGGVYHMTNDGGENWAWIKLTGWNDHCADGFRRFSYLWRSCGDWMGIGSPRHPGWVLPENVEIRYPKLPAMSFKLTPDQISDRSKTVTRRKNRPAWWQPGRLFMAWDRSFRGGKVRPRGLGVFRVVGAGRQGHTAAPTVLDTLTPEELAREGFPVATTSKRGVGALAAQRRLDRDAAVDFWSMLVKAGNVLDGRCWRLEFEVAT